ncbi:MAG: 3-hydroxybutyryl-CoA dehydrogenase [Ectothiorhodospiraceae bacterium AqS1]|nr:3-hydroxybutyryl-CoA dehydrogenase [Ectothiorhodospiraceae bacterium AqS1]
MNFRTIGIVGAGTMGRGIAQVCVQRGFDVMLNDVDAKAIDAAAVAIEKQLARAVEKGRISAEDQGAAMSRLYKTPTIDALSAVDLCIEAATENPDLKLDLFRRLEGVCSVDAVIASNTSSISLTRIAGVCNRPERVIGMHFFNPVPVMELVELIRALQTSDATFDAVSTFAQGLGKSVVSVKDSPGFVVNRMLVPLINEAVFVLAEGLAEAEEIDAAMKLGANHPIGPLALADLVGLDVCLYVLDVLYREFSDSKYRACPLLRRMVDAGRLGRKSGRGFFEYG